MLLASLAPSCSRERIVVAPADDIYAAATKDFEDGNYEVAIERYRQLLDHYPLDPRGEEVEYRIAQAHYRDGAYAEAIAAFEDFRRMYPTSPRLPEVEYLIGQAHMDQMGTVDRDLSAAREAHDFFRSVILRYPGTEFSRKAAEQLRACREQLARRDLYVAQFYLHEEKSRAADARILDLLDRYPDTEAAIDALHELAATARDREDEHLAELADRAAAELEAAHADQGEEVVIGRELPGGESLRELRAVLRTAVREAEGSSTSAS